MIFTIGSDIEVFARNKEGRPVALCGLIGGTKQHPMQLPDLPKGFMVQEDNVSLEYNIPVAQRGHEFVSYVDTMHRRVKDILSAMNLNLSTESSISFPEDELQHPQAKVFGCEPDYNAWTKMENQKPRANDPNLRTAGGHVHVGTQEVDMILGIRAMDLFLGVPSVLLDNSPASVKRRELYGKAGAMRPKPYGFEYRVLSNFWMFDKDLTSWVFNNTKKAMEWARHGTGNDLPFAKAAIIQECINTGDAELAKKLIDDYRIPLPEDYKNAVEEPTIRAAKLPKMDDWLNIQLQAIQAQAAAQAVAVQTGTGHPVGVNPNTWILDEPVADTAPNAEPDTE